MDLTLDAPEHHEQTEYMIDPVRMNYKVLVF